MTEARFRAGLRLSRIQQQFRKIPAVEPLIERKKLVCAQERMSADDKIRKQSLGFVHALLALADCAFL